MKLFTGVFTAIVTPFKDGNIDFNSLNKLIDWQVAEGVDGFVVNGTTAESPCLEVNEVSKIFNFVREKVGKPFPLILGTGSNSTKKTIEATIAAEKIGADGALVVTPYYNKPTQGGLVEHFKHIASATDLPIMMYNVPGRTITWLELDTICELMATKNIVGIKEASGDLDFVKKVIEVAGNDFTVTSGDDGTCMDLMLAGGDGVISVSSHVIPRALKALSLRAREGQSSVREDYKKYNRLTELLFKESNPIPVKYALTQMGILSSSEMRLPMTSLSSINRGPLESELQQLGLLDAK